MGSAMQFRDLDIPEKLREALEEQGFREMYPPQAEAIPKALTGRSLVAAVPTASGKSMIGFVPALSMVLSSGKKVLYIVPLKALASEKRDDLNKFAHLGIKVVMTTGDPDRDDDVSDADIVIATSEKADSMIRHGNRWTEDLGMVIADEVHMIADPGRGPTLEIAMTKFMHRNRFLQVIALSATISNAEDLALWLRADLVKSDWRPTKLKEGVYYGNDITFVDPKTMKREVREVPPEKEPIWGAVKQTIEEGGQAMIFVNTRRSTEALAKKFSKPMKELTGSSITEAEQTLLEGGDESTAVGKILAGCVACGIAFHHAGLDYKQRRFVEDGFRNRTIKCIVATPTLAAGINLPARRVIVRDTYRFESNAGNVPISVMEVQQMCGRAGRPGYDPYGEAVLIAKSDDDYDHLIYDYITHETERLTSKLGRETILRSHILGLVATGDVKSEYEIKSFLEGTFLGATSDLYGLDSLISKVVEFLSEQGMIEEAGGNVRILPFGKRVSDLYIDPWSAVILKKAVLRITEAVDDLQILHAVSCTPDVMGMYPKKTDQNELESVDAEYSDFWLVDEKDESMDSPDWDNSYEIHLSNLKTALVLKSWIDEKSEDTITDHMKIGPGDIRSRVDTADWILYAMNEIAYIFNPDASKLIKPLLTRLRYGVREELIPLVTFRGVGRNRARTLFTAGFKTRQDLAAADVNVIAGLPKIGKALARSIKEQVGYTRNDSTEPPRMYDDEAEYMLEKMAAEMESKTGNNNQTGLDMF